jgi:hypothetical protein
MRRVLLICLSLVLALGGWSAVGAEDGFYVIPSMKVVPKTGQTEIYGARDDGTLQRGVAWPTPRFTDNGNGTVTDNLTRLIWMKNANAFGTKNWADALTAANGLKSGDAGTDLTDGSKAGDWRLPSLRELQSLPDYGRYSPVLPADAPFIGVQFTAVDWSTYWSSTTDSYSYSKGANNAWTVHFADGDVNKYDKSTNHCVWCVRGSP